MAEKAEPTPLRRDDDDENDDDDRDKAWKRAVKDAKKKDARSNSVIKNCQSQPSIYMMSYK